MQTIDEGNVHIALMTHSKQRHMVVDITNGRMSLTMVWNIDSECDALKLEKIVTYNGELPYSYNEISNKCTQFIHRYFSKHINLRADASLESLATTCFAKFEKCDVE